MKNFDEGVVSRRAVLYAAAAGSGVLLGGLVSISGASAVSTSTTHQGGQAIAGANKFLDIHGLRDEYRQAVATFPLSLPDGWSFPPESRKQDEGAGVLWEKGSGAAEVYFFWQFAVASAAHEAHTRGDGAQAARLLDILEAGYQTPLRRRIVEDPNGTFIVDVIGPARGAGATARGLASSANFDPLMNAVAP